MAADTACAGAGASGEPHRLQNRDCGSVKVFPHFLQVRTGAGALAGSRAPHRLQNTDASSGAGVPQLLHFLFISTTSGIEFTQMDD
jgi:hypothetical protein